MRSAVGLLTRNYWSSPGRPGCCLGRLMEAHALREQGWTISAIARHLGRDRKTVRACLEGRRVPEVRVRREATPAEPLMEQRRLRLGEDPHLSGGHGMLCDVTDDHGEDDWDEDEYDPADDYKGEEPVELPPAVEELVRRQLAARRKRCCRACKTPLPRPRAASSSRFGCRR